MTALTFVRGRTEVAITESGSPAAEAGQFAVHRSRSIRTATSDRVQVTLEGITAASGGVIAYFDPDYAYDSASLAGRAPVAQIFYDANEYILIEYIKGVGAAFYCTLFRGGANVGQASVAATFTAGQACVLYAAWDGSTVEIGFNGGAFATGAQSNSPASMPTIVDLGYSTSFGTYMGMAVGCLVQLTGRISAAQWAILAALRAERPPAPREAIEAKMAGLWYGGHTISWDFTATDCDGIDLLNTAGVKVRETDGLGGAPVQNRIVETPLRDGASYVDTRLQPRVVRLPLAVYDDDSQADWYTLRRTLLAAFNPLPGPGVLTFAPSTTLYEATAIYDSGLEYSARAGTYLQRSPLALLCHDPAWRVAVAAEGSGTVPAAGLSIPLTIPLVLDESAVDITVTSESDDSLDTYPVFEFTAGSAGSTGLTLTNTTTGEALAFGTGLALSAGQVVTVDMGERTAIKTGGTNVIGYREAGSVMWALQAGANAVTVAVDTGSGTVKVRHYTRLIGI